MKSSKKRLYLEVLFSLLKYFSESLKSFLIKESNPSRRSASKNNSFLSQTSFEKLTALLNFSDNDLYGSIPNDQSIEFNKVDLGAFIGMSHHLTEKIILNSRISNSILPVRPHASGAIYQLNRGQYNSVLSFTLHYIL